jgi:hypothetical protein
MPRKPAKLKQEHGHALESLRADHASELKRVNDEYSALVERLNEANISNVRDIRVEYEGQFASLRDQHEAELRTAREEMEQTVQMFRDEHARSTDALRTAHEAGLQAMRLEFTESANTLKQEQEALRTRQAEEHRREVESLQKLRAELEASESRLKTENRTLQETIRELNEGIKEARRNNAFSLSRSGDRLIRVIRSVQELASELEETSRTVTDGEYSFIGAIKDQRDRDTVLRLAGEHRKIVDDEDGGETPAKEPEAAPKDTDSVPPRPGRREQARSLIPDCHSHPPTIMTVPSRRANAAQGLWKKPQDVCRYSAQGAGLASVGANSRPCAWPPVRSRSIDHSSGAGRPVSCST